MIRRLIKTMIYSVATAWILFMALWGIHSADRIITRNTSLTFLGTKVYAEESNEPAFRNLDTCQLGVHLLSPSDDDIKKAAELINTNGGKNCWLTFVVREDEMTIDYFRRIHDFARRYEFQPIIRIEKGFDTSGRWLMPDERTVQTLIDVLEDPTFIPYGRDMYFILGNEPTHSAMCGDCTPESYAGWAMNAIRMLHAVKFSSGTYDVHVMLAGQDVASPQQPGAGLYDADIFMQRMFQAQPDLLCEIDAWASHSYPRSFVGPSTDYGRLSPRGYEWELSRLRAYADAYAKPECKDRVADLPIFITETGYRTGFGGISDQAAYTETLRLAEIYRADPRIRAVTFFAYRYCGDPFESFALLRCDDPRLNGVGEALKGVSKTAGEVRHLRQARTTMVCPEELVEGVDAECILTVENRGTDMWKNIDGSYDLTLIGVYDPSLGIPTGIGSPRYSFTPFREVLPGQKLTAVLTYNPGSRLGPHNLTVGLNENGRLVLGFARWNVEVFRKPSLTMNVRTVFGAEPSIPSDDVQLQIFDKDEKIVHRQPVEVTNGIAHVNEVPDVAFGTCYRIVLLAKGNLPVQKECVQFEKGVNTIEMPRLLPLDKNFDGQFTLSDLL